MTYQNCYTIDHCDTGEVRDPYAGTLTSAGSIDELKHAELDAYEEYVLDLDSRDAIVGHMPAAIVSRNIIKEHRMPHYSHPFNRARKGVR